jgi:hypothetical protein
VSARDAVALINEAAYGCRSFSKALSHQLIEVGGDIRELTKAVHAMIPDGAPVWCSPRPGSVEFATLAVRRDQWERVIAALARFGGPSC